MKQPILYRAMNVGEEDQAALLLTRVFDEFVAPHFSPKGITGFYRYVQPAALLGRSRKNHILWVAERCGQMIGVVEVRNGHHVSLLFVDRLYQRMGVGQELLRRVLRACRPNETGEVRVTIHASPNAVPAYERMGFKAEGSEQSLNGIRFLPMVHDRLLLYHD